jgi:hypothetical protein
MLPVDSDFILLYIFYLGVFFYFLLGTLSKKKRFKINLILFLIYTAFMGFIFLDKENFTGGGSLVVFFYGVIILFSHLFIYGIIEFIYYIRKKN